jgi:hypothetical protein
MGTQAAVREEDQEQWQVLSFSLTPEMMGTVRRALEAAKTAGETESDNQALEWVCADFLAGIGIAEDSERMLA